MITAHSERRKSSDASRGGAPSPVVAPLPALVRPRLAILSDVICSVVVLALGTAAGFPLVWGLALHQTPMAVSAGSTGLLCVVVLLNRCFAPAAARTHAVPFLAALEERPSVLALCLVLALVSVITLIACWPGVSG